MLQNELPRLGFGCGGYWGLPAFPMEDAAQLVRQACVSGISFLDTGPSYSRGNAEVRLGQIVSDLPDQPFIGTKVGSEWAGNRIKRDLSAEALLRSADESRQRLRRDVLDLIQLHCRNADEVRRPDVIDALTSLRNRGVCRYIGVSGDDEAAAAAIALGEFDGVMVTYNVMHRSSRPIIDQAATAGLAVMVKSPLAHAAYNPRFFRPNTRKQLWYLARFLKNHPRSVLRARRLRALTSHPGWSGPQLALRFVLETASVSAAVLGTTSAAHLSEAAAAARRPLDADTRALLSSI